MKRADTKVNYTVWRK